MRDDARTTVAGSRYHLEDAPMEPKATGPLPLLIGASGQKRHSHTSSPGTPTSGTPGARRSSGSRSAGFDEALDAAGRDRASLYRSTQALVFLGDDGKQTADDFAKVRPAIGGTSEELIETIGQWADAGLDELIVPSFTLGSGDRAKEAIGAAHRRGRPRLPLTQPPPYDLRRKSTPIMTSDSGSARALPAGLVLDSSPRFAADSDVLRTG